MVNGFAALKLVLLWQNRQNHIWRDQRNVEAKLLPHLQYLRLQHETDCGSVAGNQRMRRKGTNLERQAL